MVLGEVRHYLKKRRTVSLIDITHRFDISDEAAQFAMDYWIRKGSVNKVSSVCGSSCNRCQQSNENYHWIESGQVIQFSAVPVLRIG
ncbi:MAG: hypothetical protein KAG28_02685 [Cocleimonas sp.]|nr:hypothetical protein [Cocleimonas sp.]